MSVHPHHLEHRPIGRLLFEFSAPSILAAMVSATYNFVARIFVGRALGPVAMAALGVSFPVMLISLAFAMMIGTGASTLISIHLGENRRDKAEEVVGQALLMYGVLSVIFLVFGLVYLEPLLRLFGATETILPYARSYLSIIIWGTIFQHIAFGVNNFIRSEGKPRIAMITMILSGVLNLFFDWFFLFVLKTGIEGAAVANILALGITSLWVMGLYLSGRMTLKWRLKSFVPNRRLACTIALFGMVPLVMQGCSAIIQGVQNNLLGYYGAIYGIRHGLGAEAGSNLALGVMAAIFPIVMLVGYPLLGLSQGMQPIVGYNVGAGRPDRVHHALRLSLRAAVGLCLVCWVALVLWPTIFFVPFTNPNHPHYSELIALGGHALRIITVCIPLVGVNVIAGGYFQAHGRPVLSLMLTLLRQMIFLLPILFGFPYLLHRFEILNGLDGIWAAYPLADFAAFLVTSLFLAREYRLKGGMIPPDRR